MFCSSQTGLETCWLLGSSLKVDVDKIEHSALNKHLLNEQMNVSRMVNGLKVMDCEILSKEQKMTKEKGNLWKKQ